MTSLPLDPDATSDPIIVTMRGMTTMTTEYTVHELATLAGVSVRTLHHYHHIGLLHPARVGDNGYRYYGAAELVRLQQILFFRELEFPLDRIRELLDRPDLDAAAAYRDHRRFLVARREQLSQLIATLDQQLRPEEDDMAERGPLDESRLTDAERAALRGSRFTAAELEALRDEARRRWSGTDAWRQSEERTRDMGPADYQRANDELAAMMRALVAVMPEGSSSPAVQQQIRTYRTWLEQFAVVPDEMFRCWAAMYVDDDRFAETFRQYHPDLPVFLRDAMLSSLGDRP